jgi:RecA-family ATPase
MELNNAQLDAEVIALDARRNDKQRTPLLIHSKNFIADFAPPDYLIEGIARKRFLYSFTGQTGSGKTAICLRIAAHVALGLSLANREIDPGRVLYLAGENPDDVRMRWIAMSERMGLDDAQIYFIGGRILISENLDHLRDEALGIGGADLVVVDTSAAFFEADDENDNTKMLAHAHLLRSLTGLPGAPCVIAACHPTKGASNDNLIPRGGGAFLNEMDGNLVAKKNR